MADNMILSTYVKLKKKNAKRSFAKDFHSLALFP